MNFRNVQAPTAVVMVRPHRFEVNPQTLADNAFQVPPRQSMSEAVASAARNEFDACVDALVAAGVRVHVFDDFGQLDLGYAPPFSPVWDPTLIAARKAGEAR